VQLLERHGFERIETGQLVDTYARSTFEDTRRNAQRFGARGTTVKAYKPQSPRSPRAPRHASE